MVRSLKSVMWFGGVPRAELIPAPLQEELPASNDSPIYKESIEEERWIVQLEGNALYCFS